MTLDDAAIERLVAEARDGDPWAFGLIFDHYHDRVYRFIASRVQRPSDAEDLTQHVFVKALEALPRYEPRGIPFGGWLFRLARNAIIDQIRTQKDHLPLLAAVARETDEAGPEQRAALRQIVEAGPDPSVDGLVRWRLIDLARWVFVEFGIAISKQTLSRMLRQMGYRKLSARPRHYAQDPAAPAAFKKALSRAWQKSPGAMRPAGR